MKKISELIKTLKNSPIGKNEYICDEIENWYLQTINITKISFLFDIQRR